MKKYLSVICALLTLTAFVSCGDSNISDDSLEMSESSISETTTQETTEQTAEKTTVKTTVLKTTKEKKVTYTTTKKETEPITETTTKFNIIANRNVKARIGDISFKIPDGYEKEANSSDESAETVTYTYDDLEMINIAKQPGASQFDWDSIDDETKKSVFEVFIESALSNYFDKTGDLEIITINKVFAVKQNAVYSGTTLPLTAYAFVYGDNLYMFMFTNMIDTQNEIIDSISFKSISVNTTKEQTTKSTTQEVTKATEPVTEPPTEKEVIKDDVLDVPTDYKKALKKAQSYNDTMHMSKAGIYNQLTSEYGENFSAEAATYAIENLNADYNANALEKAKNYSDGQYMSKIGIYNQLILEYGEQFTESEAQYAVDNLVTDYNRNALEKAKSYQEIMAMSIDSIYEQLISEYGEQFTPEEAQYAIDNLN